MAGRRDVIHMLIIWPRRPGVSMLKFKVKVIKIPNRCHLYRWLYGDTERERHCFYKWCFSMALNNNTFFFFFFEDIIIIIIDHRWWWLLLGGAKPVPKEIRGIFMIIIFRTSLKYRVNIAKYGRLLQHRLRRGQKVFRTDNFQRR